MLVVNVYLFPALGLTPRLIAATFEGLDRSKWDLPTHPGRFTPREIAAHLAEWEPILLGRMKQAVSSPGSTITPQDEGQLAIDHDYASKDPLAEVAAFALSREKTVEWLKGLTDDQWALSAVHPERGVQSVYDMANVLVCHDVYHVAQLNFL